MSRLNEIYLELIEAKVAEAALASLDSVAGENMAYFISELSNSKVSIWRLWCWIVAFYLWSHEKTDQVFRSEYEYLAKLNQPTTLRWYQKKTLNFLFGKPLVWNEELDIFEQKLEDTDDESALKIIKYCAVTLSPNQIRVKVARNESGAPNQITAAQEEALLTFLNLISPAGDNIVIVNQVADELQISFDAYVDPLVINVATGELHSEPGVKPIELAVKNYLLNLEFNGRFVKTKFIDEIQKAKGYADVELTMLEYKFGSFPYQPIEVSVIPDSGYFVIDSININYLPAQ